ncbi:MAG: VOC family protein, partial [Alphaproteobacteria bacterium]
MTAAATGIFGIDHTIVGVRDLELARASYGRLGFTITPRGKHIGWGTANYCIMFQNDYVELLGIVDATQFTNDLDKFLAQREGLLGLAFGAPDNEIVKRAFDALGIASDGPKDLKRLLELPEGTAQPAFKLLFPSKEATPGLSAFVVQHLTPQLLRQNKWLHHANGAVGIASVSVAADEPMRYAAAYKEIFGSGAVTVTPGTVTVATGGARLIFSRDTMFRLPGVA